MDTYALIISKGVANSLKSYDFTFIQTLFDEVKMDPRTRFIALYTDSSTFDKKTEFLTEVYKPYVEGQKKDFDTAMTKDFSLEHFKSMHNITIIERPVMSDALENGGKIFIGVSDDILNEEINGVITTFIMFGLILLVLGIISSLYLSNKISKPIVKAKKIAEQISMGNFDFNETTNSHDEAGRLINSLNKMKSNLEGIIHEIQSVTENSLNGRLEYRGDENEFEGQYRSIIIGLNQVLNSISDPICETKKVLNEFANGNFIPKMSGAYAGDYLELSNDIDRLGESLKYNFTSIANDTEILFNNINLLQENANELISYNSNSSDQTHAMISSIKEINSSISENAKNSKQTETVAHSNGELAHKGSSIIKQNVNMMKQISEVVNKSGESIKDLEKSSKAIGDLTSVIQEIVDQTNLLALNAAIEAARAGESVRGFAVVADEVRKLAEKTVVATEDISKTVNIITKETNLATNSMASGEEKIKQGIDLSDKTTSSMEQILNSTENLKDLISNIASSSV